MGGQEMSFRFAQWAGVPEPKALLMYGKHKVKIGLTELNKVMPSARDVLLYPDLESLKKSLEAIIKDMSAVLLKRIDRKDAKKSEEKLKEQKARRRKRK
jgi:hypothetical protein